MDVWAVIRYWSSGSGQLIAVFSTQELARTFTQTREDAEERDFDIEHHRLDELPAAQEASDGDAD